MTQVLEAVSETARQPVNAALVAWLLMASVTDARTRRIPNWLTGSGVALAFAFSLLLAPGLLQGFQAWWLGLAVGLLLPMPLYLLRVMGAGDVKLLAMVGAFLGPQLAWQAVLASFIAGGFSAALFALSQGALGRLLAHTRDLVYVNVVPGSGLRLFVGAAPGTSLGRLPYASSICAGTVVLLVLHQLLRI